MSSIASGYCQKLELSLQSVRLTPIISKRKFCVFLGQVDLAETDENGNENERENENEKGNGRQEGYNFGTGRRTYKSTR